MIRKTYQIYVTDNYNQLSCVHQAPDYAGWDFPEKEIYTTTVKS
jgi:hypothetical protein